jgi:hypothetical protein
LVVQELFPKESGTGYAVAVVVFSLGVAHFLGSLLGSLSHTLVERMIWRPLSPLNLEGLARAIGAKDTTYLNSLFAKRFGIDLRDDNLNEASFLCSYEVWSVDQNLGAMTGRIDAECLGAQSSILVASGLTLWNIIRGIVQCSLLTSYNCIWLLSIFVAGVAACLGFNHLRKRRLYGRFAMFLVISAHRLAAPGTAV